MAGMALPMAFFVPFWSESRRIGVLPSSKGHVPVETGLLTIIVVAANLFSVSVADFIP